MLRGLTGTPFVCQGCFSLLSSLPLSLSSFLKLGGDLALLKAFYRLPIPLITPRPVPLNLTRFYFSRVFPSPWSPPLTSCSYAFAFNSEYTQLLPTPGPLSVLFLCQEGSSPCSLTGCCLLILQISSCMFSPQRTPTDILKQVPPAPCPLNIVYHCWTHAISPRPSQFFLHKMQVYTSLCLYLFLCFSYQVINSNEAGTVSVVFTAKFLAPSTVPGT